MLLITFDNQLGTAPPNHKHKPVRVGRVLDISTGTGSWAIDFGDEHPEAEVLGVDFSAIQAESTPPNVKFEIADVEEPYLTPNGYIELTECDFKAKSDDGTLTDNLALVELLRMWAEAAAELGQPFREIELLVDVLREIGFVDVEVRMEKWPSNPWPRDRKLRELGFWNLENFTKGIGGFVMAPLIRTFNWSHEEVIAFADQPPAVVQKKQDFIVIQPRYPAPP
ncbi:methyltransferase domain-containing protein [Colletotrichum sojae]|uniref:Methyltransferase domain-containing protein n=1 Tax=Colletotrichum sojae TaxID=2175907 RepID=A0A8H6JNA2_9PEZI|nr:methyltransferase domain-containing protein [Colletotrichum sojae]